MEALSAAPVCRAVQLTTGDSVKTALLVELDVSVSLKDGQFYNGANFDCFLDLRWIFFSPLAGSPDGDLSSRGFV